MKTLLVAILISAFSFPAFSQSKASQIVASVKKSCDMKMTQAQARKHIKRVFLLCRPGKKIFLASGCKIECLKSNKGSVIGGN